MPLEPKFRVVITDCPFPGVETEEQELARIGAEGSTGPDEVGMALGARIRSVVDRIFGRGAPASREPDTRPLIIADMTGGSDPFATNIPARSKSEKQKEKARRKQAKANRRRNK